MRSIEHRLAADTSQSKLRRIDQLNHDALVDGILVQMPLPPQLDELAVINAINPDKDVDGFHVVNTPPPRASQHWYHDTLWLYSAAGGPAW